MKKIAAILIGVYQYGISPLLKNILGVGAMCRYAPTCSEYTKQSIEKYGVLKGSLLGIKRIVSCQPFAKAYKQRGYRYG